MTRATLYAYTSRGQLRSEPVPGRPRERRYYREDVERLQDRKEARRDPAKAAARGLHWGGPVLESGITLIHDGRLYYRGRDAVALAETATLEDVAALLWAAEDSDRDPPVRAAVRALPSPTGAAASLRDGSAHAAAGRAADRRARSIWRPTTCARPRSGRPARASSGC